MPQRAERDCLFTDCMTAAIVDETKTSFPSPTTHPYILKAKAPVNSVWVKSSLIPMVFCMNLATLPGSVQRAKSRKLSLNKPDLIPQPLSVISGRPRGACCMFSSLDAGIMFIALHFPPPLSASLPVKAWRAWVREGDRERGSISYHAIGGRGRPC